MTFSFLFNLSYAQQATIIKFSELNKLLSQANDTTYIFNFWATWCRPCVKELPYFQEVDKKYGGSKVKVVLVSLDFKKSIAAVDSFLVTRKIGSQVYLLDEVNYNSWIDKVDTSWSGAIPATLIINNKQHYRRFYEKEFKADELFDAIENALTYKQ